MSKKQNLRYVKPYFNDGVNMNTAPDGWKSMFQKDDKKKACRNMKRTKVKRKK